MVDRFCVNLSSTTRTEDLRMLDDRVLLKKQERDKSAGGINLAGNGIRTEHCYGKVMRVGRGFTSEVDGKVHALDVEEGETVLSLDYLGDKVQENGAFDYFKLIREHMIWAKVKLGKNMEIKEVEPFLNRVLVRIIDTNTTSGGIKLPDTHQTRGYCMAQVVKVGPGWKDLKTGYRYPMTVKPGDFICMLRYAGSVVKLESDELRLIEERPYMDGDPQPDILFIAEDWKEWDKYD